MYSITVVVVGRRRALDTTFPLPADEGEDKGEADKAVGHGNVCHIVSPKDEEDDDGQVEDVASRVGLVWWGDGTTTTFALRIA